MKKIESIIRPDKLGEIRDALGDYGVKGMTVSQVMGCGKQKGYKEFYRGAVVNINLLPKVKIEIVTKDEHVDEIVDLICKIGKTGEVGDGKIFIYDIEDVYRIRTGERGEEAL